jgi:hypothetical protein
MKSIWLFILMTGGIMQLKAQQLTHPLITAKNPDNSLYQYFREKSDYSPFKTPPVAPKTNLQPSVVPTVKELKTPEMADNMPIVKLRSDDKMPVAKPGDPDIHYTMLIQGYGKVKTDSAGTRP